MQRIIDIEFDLIERRSSGDGLATRGESTTCRFVAGRKDIKRKKGKKKSKWVKIISPKSRLSHNGNSPWKMKEAYTKASQTSKWKADFFFFSQHAWLWIFWKFCEIRDNSSNCLLPQPSKYCSLLCRGRLFATPWTAARQAPLTKGFSRQEYWSGLLFPPPGESSWPRDRIHVSCISCIGRWIL